MSTCNGVSNTPKCRISCARVGDQPEIVTCTQPLLPRFLFLSPRTCLLISRLCACVLALAKANKSVSIFMVKLIPVLGIFRSLALQYSMKPATRQTTSLQTRMASDPTVVWRL